MFERPLLYLVPPYAVMLLIAVQFGLVPSPFLCLPALAVLLIGAAFAVRHRRAFIVLAMLCAAVFALVQLSLCDRYLAQPVRELNGRSAVVRATVLQDMRTASALSFALNRTVICAAASAPSVIFR